MSHYKRRIGYRAPAPGIAYATVPRYQPRVVRARRGPGRRIQPAQRGYLRVGGYYGRYANGGELKFLDTQVDDAVVASGSTIAADTINIIAQGVLENQRVGRKCTIKAINWRWTLRILNTGTIGNTSDIVRIILYLDKQTNGAPATAILILEAGAGSVDFQSYNNLENKGRFRILYDKTVTMQCMSGSGRGTTDTLAFGEGQKHGSFYKKCNIPIEYDNSASTGVLTTIRSNNLGVLLLSQDGNCVFTSKFRLRFSDA